jgi:hypothetical protein
MSTWRTSFKHILSSRCLILILNLDEDHTLTRYSHGLCEILVSVQAHGVIPNPIGYLSIFHTTTTCRWKIAKKVWKIVKSPTPHRNTIQIYHGLVHITHLDFFSILQDHLILLDTSCMICVLINLSLHLSWSTPYRLFFIHYDDVLKINLNSHSTAFFRHAYYRLNSHITIIWITPLISPLSSLHCLWANTSSQLNVNISL